MKSESGFSFAIASQPFRHPDVKVYLKAKRQVFQCLAIEAENLGEDALRQVAIPLEIHSLIFWEL